MFSQWPPEATLSLVATGWNPTLSLVATGWDPGVLAARGASAAPGKSDVVIKSSWLRQDGILFCCLKGEHFEEQCKMEMGSDLGF